MKKLIFYILVLILITGLIGCENKIKSNNVREEKMTVAVSIIPQETFVKAVAKDLVNVVTMIPPGNSPANYQPTPKQMASLSDSKVYFSIGVPTEESNILSNIYDFNKDIKVVSLADIIAEKYPHRYFSEGKEHDEHDGKDEEHNHSGRDPHIWLSPKRVKVMVATIADELVELDPQNKSVYEKNSKEYINKLDELDNQIKDTLNKYKGESFIIYHPAFGYFADDYGLNMVTIEKEGKQATAKELRNVIDFANKENIKVIFYQEEFDSNQADTIAQEIGGITIKVAPLHPDYIENLRGVSNKFKEAFK